MHSKKKFGIYFVFSIFFTVARVVATPPTDAKQKMALQELLKAESKLKENEGVRIDFENGSLLFFAHKDEQGHLSIRAMKLSKDVQLADDNNTISLQVGGSMTDFEAELITLSIELGKIHRIVFLAHLNSRSLIELSTLIRDNEQATNEGMDHFYERLINQYGQSIALGRWRLSEVRGESYFFNELTDELSSRFPHKPTEAEQKWEQLVESLRKEHTSPDPKTK